MITFDLHYCPAGSSRNLDRLDYCSGSGFHSQSQEETGMDPPQGSQINQSSRLTPGLHVDAKVHVLEEELLTVVAKVDTCEYGGEAVRTLQQVRASRAVQVLQCRPRMGGDSGGGFGKVNLTVYSLGLLSSSGASWLSSSARPFFLPFCCFLVRASLVCFSCTMKAVSSDQIRSGM